MTGTRFVLVRPTIHDDEWCIYDRLHCDGGEWFHTCVCLCGRETTLFSERMNYVATPKHGIHVACAEEYDRFMKTFEPTPDEKKPEPKKIDLGWWAAEPNPAARTGRKGSLINNPLPDSR